ncbi:selenium cofactor biosynthesis protein YqeC [Chloroflexota bacterium]
MRLEQALRVQRGDVISFIGAGGKTSALIRLGQELAAQGWRVLATTTTRIAASELAHVPLVLAIDDSSTSQIDLASITNGLNTHNFVFLYSRIQGRKVLGVDADLISYLTDRVNSDVFLIEADGSRQLPLKAPYAHEPVVPPATTQVVLCAGMDVLGQPLAKEYVYNAEAMIQRYGYPVGATIIWPWMASILRDEQLGLLNISAKLPITVLLNKVAGGTALQRQARLIAGVLLRSPRIHGVIIGQMQAKSDPVYEVRRPVGAIILAAGKSSRMGQFKVLLPWGRATVLDAIIRQLYIARLDQIIVVTGRDAEQVQQVAQRCGVATVHNGDYAQGEMLSSVQKGLQAFDARMDGALIVLGDQPQLQSYVVSRMLDEYARGQGSIVIPSFQMRRGHPVLFSRRHWPALLDLSPGSSPRDLVNQLAKEIAYVNVNTDSILQDIDTPEDYQRALRRAGLS